MSTGRPIVTKCPKCKRGKYGYDQTEKGVRRTADPQRERKCFNQRRPGAVVRTMTKMQCLDCGHEWWSTLETADRG